jgi:FMN-dependent oxidoreductase (nitrilotriacetate monooxygenase family)
MSRRLQFHIFTMDSVSHIYHGMWRHPETKSLARHDLGTWVELAKIAERGCMDSIFIADVAGLQGDYRGGWGIFPERAIHIPIGDPATLLPAMMHATENLGFVYTSSIIQYPPFTFARKASTLDHLSNGRLGWNVVTSATENAYRNVGFDQILEHDERYAWAEEYLEVVYKLWEGSWEDDAVLADVKRGIFADSSKVHKINHKGRRYSVEGPHLVEPSPQRTPVLFQAGASPAGRNFAARHAEGVFLMVDTPRDVPAVVRDVRDRVKAAGRSPEDVVFLQGLSLVVGSTEEEARRQAAELDEYIDIEASAAMRGGALGVDLATLDPQTPVTEVLERAPGLRGNLQLWIESEPNGDQLTVADLGRFFAQKSRIVGTPESIADHMQEWADAGVDGFNFIQMVTPGTFADFVDHVAPELQRRGMMQREYSPGTMREKLFPGRGPYLPDDHVARSFRHLG